MTGHRSAHGLHRPSVAGIVFASTPRRMLHIAFGLVMWVTTACGNDVNTPYSPVTMGTPDTSVSPAVPQDSDVVGIATDITPPPAPSSILYGVHSDITWYKDAAYRAKAMTAAKSLHVKVMRVGLLWMWIEYVRNRRDWSVLDDVIAQMTAAGIKPLLVVAGSPSWANNVSSKNNDEFYLYVPTDSIKFQTWVNRYKDFVTAAAQRYKGKVTLWEIGNEENDAYFWRPKPNVGQYAAWYVALRSAIKAVDPTASVALGGLNGLGYDMDAPGMRGTTFLKAVYALKVYPDIVAIHPYSNRSQAPDVHVDDAGNFDDIELARDIMVANNQSNKPLWITEWGWTIDKVTPAKQAEYLSKSLTLLESRYASYVTLATYYTEFDPTSPYHHGLYTKDFVIRPAGETFRTFLSTR